MKLAPDEYVAVMSYAVTYTLQYGHDWRLGQTLYNALLRVRQDIADDIHGTDADPFFDDRKLPAFWAAL